MLQVKANFVCDLLTTEYHEQYLEAIIIVATSDITFSRDGASAMGYL